MRKRSLPLFLFLCMLTAVMAGCGVFRKSPAKDWFAEQGLVITPQGDFTYTTMAYDMNRQDVGTFEVRSHAVITETTDGAPEGYKDVTVVFTDDTGAALDIPGAVGTLNWLTAFDRYTGASFEFDSSVTTIAPDGAAPKEGFVTIVNGDDRYDIAMSFETVNNAPVFIREITVTCPVDYNGVVFQIGYSDSVLTEAVSQIDFAQRFYTIDELPYYGDGYYYFSFADK